jgi:hypothetical protein
MKQKGQILLVTGILLTLLSMVLTKDFVPESKWIFVLSEVLLLASAVLVIWGFILVVRSIFRKQNK